jgi:hypothetical protein
VIASISTTKALAGVVALVIGVGIVLGMAISGSDLINPTTRSAEAQRISIENQRIARQNDIDMRYYEETRQEQLHHLEKRNELALELGKVFGYIFAMAVLIISAGTGVGLVVHLAKHKSPSVGMWSPERRALARREARLQEREARVNQLLARHMKISTSMGGNGQNADSMGGNGQNAEVRV